MKKMLLILLTVSASAQTIEGDGMKVQSLNFSQFESMLAKKNDTTYVVNFWAMWCGPCVKELPYFEDLHRKLKGKKVKFVLVSLDFPKQAEKNLIPFIKKRKLTAEVVHLNDPDTNSWIGKVDEGWTGSIPATLIYRNNRRKFYEQAFKREELDAAVSEFLNY